MIFYNHLKFKCLINKTVTYKINFKMLVFLGYENNNINFYSAVITCKVTRIIGKYGYILYSPF